MKKTAMKGRAMKRAMKTSGGVAKKIKNKEGRFVSKKRSAQAKKAYPRTIKYWADAVKKARKALGLRGFVPIGGKSKAGRALYKKAKSMLPIEDWAEAVHAARKA